MRLWSCRRRRRGRAKAFLRVERSDEDGLIAGLVAAAAEICEAFIGRPLLERDFTETLPADRAWRRLGHGPVRAITQVETIPAEGPALALPAAGYAIDIDSRGDGWVRLAAAGEAAANPGRLPRRAWRPGWADLPAALRQGVLRLAAHFYTNRVADGARASEPAGGGDRLVAPVPPASAA